MGHRQALDAILKSLASAGIEPVLFKGTALGYSLYPSPVLRTRGDTDLLIPLAARTLADATLVALGFTRIEGVSGEFVSYQASYARVDEDGEWHPIDLHWRINNSAVLARLFIYEELRQQATANSRLGTHALIASPVHALLLACMHRATHKQNPYYVDGVAHYGGDRLIWLYDIHLLAGTFTSAQWTEFMRLASDKGLRAVCLEGMDLARACFNTSYPAAVLAALREAGVAEPAALYLDGGPLRQLWMDFCAIEGLRNRGRFLGELMFPPASYMRRKYPEARPDWLPWLYARRAFGGGFKRIFRSAS